jgi:hypothetical protein
LIFPLSLHRVGFSNIRDMNAETLHPFVDVYAERRCIFYRDARRITPPGCWFRK